MTHTWPRLRRYRLRLVLWLAALALLAGVLQTVSLREALQALGRLEVGAWLALAVTNGLVLVTLTGRWWLLLRAWGYAIPYLTLVGYRLAAFGLSYFTPGPQFGGEPLQVHLVRRHHRAPADIAVAAVTLDKLLELLINFLFLAGGVLLIVQQQLFSTQARSAMATFSVGLLALPSGVLLLLVQGKMPLTRFLQMTDRLVAPLVKRLADNRWAAFFEATIKVARSSENQIDTFYKNYPFAMVSALLVSIASWVVMVGEYWLMLSFLGTELTLLQTLVALTAARLAFLFPLPGGLGALEASQVLAMSALGMDPALGLSVSLLIRLRDVGLGGLGLWWGGLKS